MRIILFILFTIMSLKASSQRIGIIFQSLSEGASLDAWNGIERCAVPRIASYTFIKRAGTGSTHFTSRILDSVSCARVRSQLILSDTIYTIGDKWYGMSVNFGSGYPTDYEGIDNFLEVVGPSEQPLFFLSYHGRLNGILRYPTGDYLTITKFATDGVHMYPLWSIQRNSWVDVVMRVKWRTDTSGAITIWLSGRKVFDFRGATKSNTASIRVGSNFWNWSKKLRGLPSTSPTRELYLDEFRVGNQNSEYIDVFPDNTDPTPPANSSNQFFGISTNTIQGQKIVFNVQQDTNWQANWVLKNAAGKRMMSGNMPIYKGYRSYTLSLPFSIPAGNYTFLLGTNTFMHVRKLPKL